MASQSLEQRIKAYGNPVDMLRNSQVGPYVFPIPSEFSNWRDEQEAWRKTAILFDQSYHMTDLYLEGPDVVRLLSELGVNSFKGFRRDKAKQFVACNHDGYVIGDGVLFGLEDDKVNIVGRPPISNWIEFNARTGGYDVKVERDERSLANARPRRAYRFEIQGPAAWNILTKVNGGPLPDIKFFNMGEISVAGRRVRCLRHGMSGAPGLELWGPKEEGDEIRAALLEAGKEFGLLPGGARAYSTVAIESAWIPSPMPAIYTGERMKSYREWLPATGFEANASLGGSMVSANIEDYYLTPFDLGYGGFTKFDHDFIGREALMRRAQQPSRKKVTLTWDSDDVVAIFASLFQAKDRAKYMDLPASHYATLPYDMIVSGGRQVGISTYPVYTSNGRVWISLSMIDEAFSAAGTQVKVVWGEPDGGTSKPTVERHVQTEVRATVGPAPFSDSARESYRPYVLSKGG
ncbi:MAG: aminomethyltransferase family protein [Pseudomonadota bacterium]|nr:aminomethyltransferase family protein [Pseudomonadota bacterium]